jgi:hypothetical protein
MRHGFPETFGVHLSDDLKDLVECQAHLLTKSCQKMTYLLIGTVGSPGLTGVGLAGSGTTVTTRDGRDTMANFVGVAVGERHDGNMWGSCWCC